MLLVTGGDWTRWFGVPFNLSGQGNPIANPGAGFPSRGVMPSVQLWTPEQPNAVVARRTIVGHTATTIIYTGTFVNAAANTWLFVSKNSSAPLDPGGQGNFRRVTGDAQDTPIPGQHTVTIDGATPFNPDPHDDGEVAFLTRSGVVASMDAALKVITAAGSPGWSVNQFKDRHVSILGQGSRRIAANDAGTITLDWALLGAPAAGAWFSILDGAGSAETLAGLAFHVGGSFQPLQCALDTSPVFLEGQPQTNFVNQPSGSPGDLTCNASLEMFWKFRSIFPSTIYGMVMGRDSATISPQVLTTGLPDTLYTAWQKDLRDLSFHPAAPASMFSALGSALLQSQILLSGANLTMDPNNTTLVCLCAENDAQIQFYPLIDQIGRNMRTLRDALRGLLQMPTMKWIMVGPSSLIWLPRRDEVYAQLQELVDEDPYSAIVDTRVGYTYNPIESPPVHFDTVSQIKLGGAIFDAHQAIVARLATIPPPVDEPSLTVSSAQEIVDVIDKAMLENAGVVAYTINGRTVQLQGMDQMLRARKYYAAEVSRQSGLRRTLARWSK